MNYSGIYKFCATISKKRKYIFTEKFPDKYNLQNNFYILKTF